MIHTTDNDIVDDPKEWIDRAFKWTPSTLLKLATSICNYVLDKDVSNHISARWWRCGVLVTYEYWLASEASVTKTRIVTTRKMLRLRGLKVGNQEFFNPRGGFSNNDDIYDSEWRYALTIYGSNVPAAQARIKRENKLIELGRKPEPSERILYSSMFR